MTHSPSLRLSILFFALITATSTSAIAQTPSVTVQPRIVLETVTGSQPLRDGLQIQAGPAQLRITALRDDIVRVRVAPGATLPEDASWAVLTGPRNSSVDVQPTRMPPPSASTPRLSMSVSNGIPCASSFAILPATSSAPMRWTSHQVQPRWLHCIQGHARRRAFLRPR